VVVAPGHNELDAAVAEVIDTAVVTVISPDTLLVAEHPLPDIVH
jgi:hypothetical protein